MANENLPINHKKYAEEMRTCAVIQDDIVRVSKELWQQLADVIENSAEVIHGRWDFYSKGSIAGYALCSKCGSGLAEEDAVHYTYCPYCGAKMDGDGNG